MIIEFDVNNPHPARMYNYLLGGKDNFAVDRAAVESILKVAPEVATMAEENRKFLVRAVRYLAAEAGIRQFLDIGTGIPAADNTHEVAQRVAPESRVVYVDNDRIVLAHARALLDSTEEGWTEYIEADLRDPERILAGAGKVLDFSRPVALLLVAILHFIPDEDDPAGIVASYRDALPPGSFLVLTHGTQDFHEPEVTGVAESVYDTETRSLTLWPKAAVEAFFKGFDLVDPGVVQVPAWRPDRGEEQPDLAKLGMYGGVGILPRG